jgi:hypothetical protein
MLCGIICGRTAIRLASQLHSNLAISHAYTLSEPPLHCAFQIDRRPSVGPSQFAASRLICTLVSVSLTPALIMG